MKYPMTKATISSTGTDIYLLFDDENHIKLLRCDRIGEDEIADYYPVEDNARCVAELIAMLAEHEIQHYLKRKGMP